MQEKLLEICSSPAQAYKQNTLHIQVMPVVCVVLTFWVNLVLTCNIYLNKLIICGSVKSIQELYLCKSYSW